MMKYKIIPTLIAKDQKKLDYLFNRYKKHSKYFQVDIMDGKFVKNKSNWFNFKLPKNYFYEAHLMVENPERWVYKNFYKVNVIIANFEGLKDPFKLISFCRNKKKKIMFAVNPETSVNELNPYLKYLDGVLVLTVHPGRYGAKFLPETLEKIRRLRIIYKKNIEVDGHQDPKNIRLCKKAGANLFAVGSYLKNSKDIGRSSMKELKNALR